MFTNDERNEITELLKGMLEEAKAGRADEREVLAGKMADAVRELLAKKYEAPSLKKNKTGTITLRDTLISDDFVG